MKLLLAIAIGGAIGAVGRHYAAGQVMKLTGGSFPWGTVTVNVADGHFIVTFPVSIGDDRMMSPSRLRLVARNAEGEIVYEGGIS